MLRRAPHRQQASEDKDEKAAPVDCRTSGCCGSALHWLERQRHWSGLAQLDPRSLFAFRAALAAVVAWDAAEKVTLAPAFYEYADSSYPFFALAEDVGSVAASLNPFTWLAAPAWPRVVLAATGLLALGIPFSRACSLACWILFTAAILRNVEVTFIFDRYVHVMLLFSGALPYGGSPEPSLAALLLRLQLAWIYVDAGYGKVVGPDGDWSLAAKVPALAVYMMGAPGLGALLAHDRLHFGGWLARLATPAAAWGELLVGPAMLLAAAAAPGGLWPQLCPVLVVWSLHAFIALGMEGGAAICAAAWAGWLSMLPARLWATLGLGAAAAGGRPARCPWRWLAAAFLVACALFQLSGAKSSPGPLPTVMLLNRWRVFTGAEMTMIWEVAPARLSNGSIVDLWSWRQVSFAKPARYGRRGRWMSFPFTKRGSARAVDARFRYLCREWDAAHEVQVEKYQLFELSATLDAKLELSPPTKSLIRVQDCQASPA